VIARPDLGRAVLLIGAALLASLLALQIYFARHRAPAAGQTADLGAALILRRGNGPEPESLDPQAARSEAALTILRDLYEGLMAVGPGAAPVPAAAASYELSADGKTYTFHLRKAHWSNGQTVVAEDFVAAWRRLVDPHGGFPYAGLLAPVRGAAAITAGIAPVSTLAVRAPDPATLVVDLLRPTPYFLGICAHPATFPVNRASLAAHGRTFAKPGVMVSNGAFVLTRWDFGSHLVAVRNRYYWDDAATHLDSVEYYSIPEPAAELRAYRAGELDVTSTIPPAQYPWIERHLRDDLHIAPQLAVYYLGFNLSRPPFANNPNLRQALAMTIDRERLVKSVTGAGELPAYGLVPPGTRGYSPPPPDYAAWPMARRVARARELLHEPGAPPPPARIELRYNTGELHGRIALAVAAMWKASLGIETTLHAEEFKVLLQDIERGDVSQVFRASWVGDYDDAYSFLQLLQSGGIDPPKYSSTAYDALLARAADEGDAGRRQTLLRQAEQLMLGDQPVVPLYFYVAKHLVSPRLHGWNDNIMNVVYSKQLTKLE
jgi:oligopeptide transport system substrate-binding protein